MSIKRYRRYVIYVAGAASALGGVAILSSGASTPLTSAMLLDPLSVLSGRSPGERVGGLLNSTKPMRVAALERPYRAPFVPQERVLSLVRYRPTPAVPGGLTPGFVPDGPSIAPEGTGGLPGFSPLGQESGGVRDVDLPLGDGPIGGGGGGISSDYATVPAAPVK